ncbi:MAG: hypothetical protein ACRDU8_09470 [Egibacteraceae bacterium]
MINRWEDLEELLVAEASEDLRDSGEVRPALSAFRGDDLLFLAWLRPFATGAYADPLIELCALAMPLDADRLALSISGRVWSLDDPIPPVTEGADLRQRALVVHVVDGAGDTLQSHSAIHPYDLSHGDVSWAEPRRLEGGDGWICGALEIAVRDRARLRADAGEIRKQAARVDRLGHELYLPPEILLELLPAGLGR